MRKILLSIATLVLGFGTIAVVNPEVAHATTGCVSSPSSCGWPDATNTGDTNTGNNTSYSGAQTLGSPNGTLGQGGTCLNPVTKSDLDISGTLEVTSSGYNITNSVIHVTSGSPAFVIKIDHGVTCVSFSHVTVVGNGTAGQICFSYGIVGGGNGASGYLDISGCEVGIKNETSGDRIAVSNSYIHDLSSSAGAPNYVGLYSLEPGGTVNVWPSEHNTIFVPSTGYGIESYKASTTNYAQIGNFLISGGTYNIYVHGGGGTPGTAWIVGNQLKKGPNIGDNYVTRNTSVVTTLSGYGSNYDDVSGNNIDSSM